MARRRARRSGRLSRTQRGRMAKVIEELPNTSDEEKAELKRDLRNIGVNALSTADHDFCDACGKYTVVTDVWIDRTPMTLCQPCVLDALTAEGEHLGQYWEIET